MDKKKPTLEVTNTRSLLRKRDLTKAQGSVKLDQVKTIKGRPRKALKQEEGEVRITVNDKLVDRLNLMADIDHEEIRMIEDDLKLLFKLCRRFKTDAIKQTYVTN